MKKYFKTGKRSLPRLNCELLCHVQSLDPRFPMMLEAYAGNISEGGLCFRSSQLVTLNKKIGLVVEIPKRRNIEVKALVLWSSPCRGISQYNVGVSFLDLGFFDKRIIGNLIEENSHRRVAC